MITLTIPSKVHDYQVNIFEKIDSIPQHYEADGSVFVVDRKVYDLYGRIFSSIPSDKIYIFDAVEDKKNLQSIIELYVFMLNFKERKNLTLVSFGGGIVQDVTGFASSTLYRGIHWIYFPTTLLAQADSCVGSKTSLNFQNYKNTIGTFYPPHCVNICTEFLATLPEEAIYSGIGEIVKFMLLDDEAEVSVSAIEKIVSDILENRKFIPALTKTHKIKQSYIKQDEFDMGKRNLFNYGHCFGHALEYSSEYNIPHGIAVTIGMLFSNLISLNRNLITRKLFDELKDKLFIPNIAVELQERFFSADELLSALRNDKKRVGDKLSIVILTSDDFTAAKVDDLTDDEFLLALSKLVAILDIS